MWFLTENKLTERCGQVGCLNLCVGSVAGSSCRPLETGCPACRIRTMMRYSPELDYCRRDPADPENPVPETGRGVSNNSTGDWSQRITNSRPSRLGKEIDKRDQVRSAVLPSSGHCYLALQRSTVLVIFHRHRNRVFGCSELDKGESCILPRSSIKLLIVHETYV